MLPRWEETGAGGSTPHKGNHNSFCLEKGKTRGEIKWPESSPRVRAEPAGLNEWRACLSWGQQGWIRQYEMGVGGRE